MITTLLHRLCLLGVTALMLALATTASAYTYRLDDGTAESAIGQGTDSDIIFLNQFSVVPGNNVIGSVSVVFGTPGISGGQIGTPVRALIYSDPNGDGNPDDAVLLSISTGVIANEDDNVFNKYSLSSPVTITGTSFFVGYVVTVPGSTYIGAVDDSNPSPGRSFYAASPAGYGNIDDLTDNYLAVGPLSNIGVDSPLLIRADTVVPEPSTYALLGVGLGLGALILRRRGSAA